MNFFRRLSNSSKARRRQSDTGTCSSQNSELGKVCSYMFESLCAGLMLSCIDNLALFLFELRRNLFMPQFSSALFTYLITYT